MKRRRPIRTVCLLLGLCLTLWRLPTTIETFAASMGNGDSPTQSFFAALNSAAGGSAAQQIAVESLERRYPPTQCVQQPSERRLLPAHRGCAVVRSSSNSTQPTRHTRSVSGSGWRRCQAALKER